MKKTEIKAALDALKEIRWDKVEDKTLRSDLIDDHFTMFDAAKKLEAEIERQREVILGPYREDQERVSALNQKMQACESPAEQRELLREILALDGYQKALKTFNEKVEEIYAGEVEGLKKIDRETFVKEIQKQSFKTAWIEGLYPLFILA